MSKLTRKVVPLEPKRVRRLKVLAPDAAAPTIDLSYLNAATVIIRDHKTIHLWLVGCGGTGSFLALNVIRLAHVLEETGRRVRVMLVDPDTVEEGNVPRSNFSFSEVGLPKAQTLAIRFGSAWGVEVAAIRRRFHPSMLWQVSEEKQLTVFIGAVDNPQARRAIARALRDARSLEDEVPSTWWLDCGNSRDTGQVLLGSEPSARTLSRSFPTDTLCRALPSPALQHPDLLRAQKDDGTNSKRRLSCMELMLQQEQSLMVNQRVAAEAGDMLMQLLLTRDLQRFATYFDTKAGVAHSLYVTPAHVAKSARVKNTASLLEPAPAPLGIVSADDEATLLAA